MAPRATHGFDGSTIRRMREERGWSQKALIQELRASAMELGMSEPGVTIPMVSRWENGKVTPGRAYAQLIEHAFRRTMIADPADHSWDDEMQRRNFLAGAGLAIVSVGVTAGVEPWQRLAATLQGRARVDQGTVDNLETVTSSLSHLFQTVAPVALAAPVRSHLDTLSTLLSDASAPQRLRARLASMAGETAVVMGWISQDQGDHAAAQNFYLAAIDAANEAGDHPLGAYAIASASTLPAFRSSPTHSVHLLTDAQVKGINVDDATPGTRSWIHTLVAEAHTRDGNEAGALNAMDDAQEALDAEDNEPRPRAAFFDAGRLAGERGVTATRLGLHDVAEAELEIALGALQPEHKTRSRLLTNLARVRLAQGEADEAVAVAVESLAIARSTGSEASVADVRSFRHELKATHDDASLADLDELLAHVI